MATISLEMVPNDRPSLPLLVLEPMTVMPLQFTFLVDPRTYRRWKWPSREWSPPELDHNNFEIVLCLPVLVRCIGQCSRCVIARPSNPGSGPESNRRKGKKTLLRLRIQEVAMVSNGRSNRIG